jgi:hypothetical protein
MLRNRNYFLRFRLRLLKSYGSFRLLTSYGYRSGSDSISTVESYTIKAGLRIRIHFIRIRIQHFRLNANPDPDPALMTKN